MIACRPPRSAMTTPAKSPFVSVRTSVTKAPVRYFTFAANSARSNVCFTFSGVGVTRRTPAFPSQAISPTKIRLQPPFRWNTNEISDMSRPIFASQRMISVVSPGSRVSEIGSDHVLPSSLTETFTSDTSNSFCRRNVTADAASTNCFSPSFAMTVTFPSLYCTDSLTGSVAKPSVSTLGGLLSLCGENVSASA